MADSLQPLVAVKSVEGMPTSCSFSLAVSNTLAKRPGTSGHSTRAWPLLVSTFISLSQFSNARAQYFTIATLSGIVGGHEG